MASSDILMSSSSTRRLYDYNDKKENMENMIEIILSSSDSAMPSKPISWELIDFDGQIGHLQLNYEGTDTGTYDYMSVKVRDPN